MMSIFSMNEQKELKIKFIAEKFKTNEKTVESLFSKYVALLPRMKEQYLAHVMRSLEAYLREKCNAPLFVITCKPSSDNPAMKGGGCASYKKGQFFNIVYDSKLDAKQVRIVIAHELGHLFWIAIANKEYEENHEPLSSIFGIFTIFDKNDFYADKTVPFQHDSWQDIVLDFSQLKNKIEGIENLS